MTDNYSFSVTAKYSTHKVLSSNKMKRILTTALLVVAAVLQAAATTVVNLAIDTVVITYWKDYSNEANNECIYTLNFSNSTEFPQVITDLTLPTPMELTEGTYTLADGTLSALTLAQNQEDFEGNLYTGSVYWFVSAELTLTRAQNGQWNYAMVMIDEDDYEYRFAFSQTPHITPYPPDPVNPKDQPYADESKQITDISLIMDTLIWNDKTVSQDGIVDIYLAQKEPKTNGLYAYIHLGMYTSVSHPTPAVYAISSSEEDGTFSASLGKFGDVLIPCYAMLLDQGGLPQNTWFLVNGSIMLTYENNQPRLSGECTSYFGSTVRFSYAPQTQDIESIQQSDVSCQKFIHDGHLFIRKGENNYDVFGRKSQ